MNLSLLSALGFLLWFLFRVLPKPTRMAYPCQQAGFATIVSYGCFTVRFLIIPLIFLKSLWGRWSRRMIFTRKVLFRIGLLLGVSTVIFCLHPIKVLYYKTRYHVITKTQYDPVYQQDITYHVTRYPRLHPRNVAYAQSSQSRVVRVEGDNATSWDYITGYYWEYVHQDVVNEMVKKGVMTLTDMASEEDAWSAILPDYQPGQRIAIKLNGNDLWNDDQRELVGLPQVANAIIKGLLSRGVTQRDISVVETSLRDRYFYPYYYAFINGLYPDVQLLDSDDSTYTLHSDNVVSFPYAEDQSIADRLVESDYIIHVPLFKAIHPRWGVSGCIKGMMGVIPFPMEFHSELDRETPDNPAVLIYQNPHILGKVVLNITDGLFGNYTGIHFPSSESEDPQVSPHDMPRRFLTFHNNSPNSLFFSIDPVAMDSVLKKHLDDERAVRNMSVCNHPMQPAAAAANLGVYEDPPFSQIEYLEFSVGNSTDVNNNGILDDEEIEHGLVLVDPLSLLTPTPAPLPTPICRARALDVFPKRQKIRKKDNGVETITVTCSNGKPVAGERVTALVKSGKRCIRVTPLSQTTDENGKAIFTITSRRNSGHAKVEFEADSLKTSVTVRVKNR